MKVRSTHGARRRLCLSAGAVLWVALAQPAKAIDEIQVYNASIAAPGQFTIQQHLNFVGAGLTTPPFPGGLVSNHSLNGTPEFAYGVTDWWEVGLYLPFAVQDRQFLSDSFKLRTLFVSPHAEQRNFFYGVNFEFSYETPRFAQTRYALEIRPIIGVRNKEWEFIVNPIVGVGIGALGEATLAPAARLARNLGENRFIGIEYYADLGQIGKFLALSQQSHQIFAVTDFQLGEWDVQLGIGSGLTPGSDGLVTKAIVGYAFPVPGQGKDASATALKSPPSTKAFTRASWTPIPDAVAAMR